MGSRKTKIEKLPREKMKVKALIRKTQSGMIIIRRKGNEQTRQRKNRNRKNRNRKRL